MLFLACTSTSEGLCDDDSGCLPGLRCEEGVCIGCADNDGCQAWEDCTADRRCELRAGMCATQKQCKAWEECGAGHTCQLAAGSCQSAANCKDYEDCDGATRKCVLQASRCTTSDDCGDGELWTPTCGQDNRCGSTSVGGNDVLLWGTLDEGFCGADAISSVMTPTRVQAGFGCYTHGDSNAFVSPSGRVYYREGDGNPARVKIFVPDTFPLKDKTRSYPSDGPKNDTRLPAPECGATQDVWNFIMQAGTGAIAYSCSGDGLTYHRLEGGVVATGHQVLSWNASGHMLAVGSGYDLIVLTPDQTAIRITGLPGNQLDTIDTRAHPTGFLLAMRPTSGVQELWHVDNAGVSERVGTYGAHPENVSQNGGGVLDAAGNLYARSSLTDELFVDVIVRRPADGSPGTIVYNENSAPGTVNAAANFERRFNFMHGSTLFTGP
ncbi:hypothetical protein D7V88_04665 [Corallococcus terminator]|uniref:Uncharacterized protein n=1 Tax=Corallococcus terminator TaxID=2316733 RepID=A0A3A8JR11_9BACT|nr:hypothetical protein D7V88_04665 [Corallococcus terminator]